MKQEYLQLLNMRFRNMFKTKVFKRFIIALLAIFVLMNIVAYVHAYKFTHFSSTTTSKTKDAHKLSVFEKIKTLMLGVSNPRPVNKVKPALPFEEITLQSHVKISGWLIPADRSKGTIILFHGYSSCKSLMLDKAEFFHKIGYNTMLIDFMGAGESEGNETTVGFIEAREVKTAFDFVKSKNEQNIILFGTSMGAVGIMKAISDYKIQPQGIIIECPFGNFLQTVQARFRTMHVPAFPMSQLLVFWGGQMNGFNGFVFNPAEYAKNINCSTLLLYGEKDEKVSKAEIDEILRNLKGRKTLVTYPRSGHENYLIKYKKKWCGDVAQFLSSL